MVAFVANTNVLELRGLKDAITGAFINSAAVTVSGIQDEDGVTIGPVSGSPFSLDYVAGSNGIYRGVLADTLPFVAAECYTVSIEVNAGIDRIGHYEFKFKPITRTSK